MKCIITIMWDDEAKVYIATSDDVPGLVMEADSLDALIERARLAIPELLELNNRKADVIDLSFRSERHYMVSNG